MDARDLVGLQPEGVEPLKVLCVFLPGGFKPNGGSDPAMSEDEL